jgi:TonB family protein
MRALVRALAFALLAMPAAADPLAAAPTRVAALEDAMPRGASLEERLGAICARVQAVLAYPPVARARRVEGTSLVAFEIGANGLARDVEIAATSGSAHLDRAAARAVHAAGRLPYVYGRLEIPVRVALEPRAPEDSIAARP